MTSVMTCFDTDAALLRRMARGETQALTPLIERHHFTLHRFIARRLGADGAEDLVADTFEIALRRAGRYEARTADARPWLLGIAANVLRDHSRREAAMYRAYARTGHDPALGSVELQHCDWTAQRALVAALAELRPDHRNALLLHVLGELSYEEVAVALDVPIGTVRAWISRARTAAARHLTAAGITSMEMSA
jgi:RNA polymerase sigma-70 factor (ECF subfamily)